MKKKILTVSLVVVLIAIMVSGTLAYFTAEDNVTNTFTIGSVEIKVEETFTAPTGMLPIVNTTTPSADENYVNKDARITNTGRNDAYVQAFVAIPSALDNAEAFHVEDAASGDWTKANGSVGTVTIKNVEYNVYKYVYNKVLNPNASTSDFITGAYLDAGLDVKKDTNGFLRVVMNGQMIDTFDASTPINVYVAGQAGQADGFGDNAVAADVLAQAFGSSLPNFAE